MLQRVAKTLQNSVRTFDIVSSWDGEAFVAVISEVEGNVLLATANRCCAHRAVKLAGRSTGPGYLSLGATLARHEDSVASITKRADQLMYVSKQTGRNHVTADL
jgi:diguanylate cyclase (GGDEF)-like protein